MRFKALAEWIQEQNPDEFMVYPGPALPPDPRKCAVLTPYGGGGYTMEQVFDNQPIQVRVIGEQGDYDSAEELAWRLDRQFTFSWPDSLGGSHVLSVSRSGGGPVPLLRDDAERTHFVASYVWQVESLPYPVV